MSHSTPPSSLRLIIDIDRPSEEDPCGYIGLIVQQKGSDRREDGVDGMHDEQTIKRLLEDVYSYFKTGRGAWQNRIKQDVKDGQHR